MDGGHRGEVEMPDDGLQDGVERSDEVQEDAERSEERLRNGVGILTEGREM